MNALLFTYIILISVKYKIQEMKNLKQKLSIYKDINYFGFQWKEKINNVEICITYTN